MSVAPRALLKFGRRLSDDIGLKVLKTIFSAIEVPAGCPAVIENRGDVDAYVINSPSPPGARMTWIHPVEGWDFAG